MGLLFSSITSTRDSVFRPYAFPIPSISYDKTLPGLKFINGIPVIHLNEYLDSPTILFSHGNSCDLGHTYYLVKELSKKLKVNIISYDYPGYGLCDGSPSESACYETIRSVYEYLIKIEKGNNVILMGQSIGTGPTCWLASELKKDSYRQVILISPFVSAVSVVSSNTANITFTSQKITSKSFDIFLNYYHLKYVENKVDYLHGTVDKLIPIMQSYQLSSVTGTVHPILNANHNSILAEDLNLSIEVLSKLI